MLMTILKTIWGLREIAYLVVIVVLLRGWLGSFGPERSPVDNGPVPIVVVPDLPEQVVAVAKKADKPKGVKESAFTKEVKPDRVQVSPPVVDGTQNQTDSVGSPRRLPSVPLDLPEWGMAEVTVDGRSLTVSALNHRTGGASKAEFRLREPHPKLSVRSGNVPHSVREGRNFKGPLRLGIRATGFGGVEYNTGEPAVGAILEGPVGLQLGLGRLTPAAVVGFGEGVKLGGSYSIEIGDL